MALVLVTGDKGLCGAFNSNLIRAAIEWLRHPDDQQGLLSPVSAARAATSCAA